MKSIVIFCLLTLTNNLAATEKGWNTLRSGWDQSSWLDFATIEWEYFMIHDKSHEFFGAVGLVLTNPRAKGALFAQVVPTGGNLAFSGLFKGQKAKSDYINFATANTHATGDSKNTQLGTPQDPEWVTMKSLDDQTLQIVGKSQNFSWDLTIRNDSSHLTEGVQAGEPFSATTDSEGLGILDTEQWTVDALWPKTLVTGTVTDQNTQKTIAIDGTGYRENSWGRYLMAMDGWDFLVFNEAKDQGVNFVLQTYHNSDKLDFLDLAFWDFDQLHKVRFNRQNLSWKHASWQWQDESRQCQPEGWNIVGLSDRYRLEVQVDIPQNNQSPFLSDIVLGTRIFFINEQYPSIKGRIIENSSKRVVQSFAGRGGGEFAYRKSLLTASNQECQSWGKKFSNFAPTIDKSQLIF